MKPSIDLTRYNRAGLRRLRFLDGNAATFLEELRLRLLERFPTWEALKVEEHDGESPQEELDRLVAQLRAARAPVPDWGWEIARSLARACHVLGEHVDAYADEGYLGTATQWESLRRLVAMLGYRPAPAVSATTELALVAKLGVAGKVGAGLAVKYVPAAGGTPMVFETIEDLQADAALNALRYRDWNRNPEALSGESFDLEGKVDLVIGEPIVLEDERPGGALAAHVITDLERSDKSTTVTVTPTIKPGVFKKGWTKVHTTPKERLAPVGGTLEHFGDTNTTSLRLVQEPAGLKDGQIVTVTDGTRRGYYVVAVHQKVVILASSFQFAPALSAFRLETTTVSIAVPLTAVLIQETQDPYLIVAGDWSRLGPAPPSVEGADVGISVPAPVPNVPPAGLCLEVVSATVSFSKEAPTVVERTQLYVVLETRGLTLGTMTAASLPLPLTLLVPPVGQGTWPADVPLHAQHEKETSPFSQLPASLITSQPRSTSAGDLVAVVSGTMVSWGRLASVGLNAADKTAKLTPQDRWYGRITPAVPPTADELFWRSETTVFGHFKDQRRVCGWQENKTAITGTQVTLEADAPPSLTVGRKVLIEEDGVPGSALLGLVTRIEKSTVTLRDALPPGRFTEGKLILSANVVSAGHGERKPDRPLGSGDATVVGQTMVLDEPWASTVPDPSQPKGVRADVEVKVAGRRYTQVADFRGHDPTETVYTVHPDEDGHLVFTFGDGVRGRRLPTGQDNVRVAFRAGAGLAGNLLPGSLVKLARVDPFIAAVRQPLLTTGGNDREDVEALRTSAPASVLTLERAVSLDDYSALAGAHASVWQARAAQLPSGRSRADQVQVVVVVAGGGALTDSLRQTLEAYVQAHALPGVQVSVIDKATPPVLLDVMVRVDHAAFDLEDVKRATRAALLDAFSLRRRRIGQPLYLSEIYHVIEAVTGVQESICTLKDSSSPPRPLQRMSAAAGQVLVLLDDPIKLTIRDEKYVP